jgi:hypothetical protein
LEVKKGAAVTGETQPTKGHGPLSLSLSPLLSIQPALGRPTDSVVCATRQGVAALPALHSHWLSSQPRAFWGLFVGRLLCFFLFRSLFPVCKIKRKKKIFFFFLKKKGNNII